MSNLVDIITDIPSKVASVWDDAIEMISSSFDALQDFRTMLEEFDESIVAMTESCGGSATGLPITDSIALFRYLVGDLAFMMIYFTVLVGCFFVIYKLVVLVYNGFDSMVNTTTGASSKNMLYNLLSKFIK